MSKSLARLLGNDHPLFLYNIAQLEKASGHAGIDTRLYADSIERAHAVMRTIGLDTTDTSTRELYQALNALVTRGSAEEVLADTDFVLLDIEDEIISFSLYDVIENAHHQLPFEQKKIDHAQRYLRRELIKRYADHERTHDDLVHQMMQEANVKQPKDEEYMTYTPNTHDDQTNTPRLLAIGDIFTDAFIKLDESYAKVEKDEEGNKWLKLPFGSKPPYERVDIVRSVGPSPNAAVSFARLGLDSHLMAWIGSDDVGKEAIDYLTSEQVLTGEMVIEEGKATSYWYVLRHGSERTMLVKSEEYAYEWSDPDETPDWIYLAYIGKDAWGLHEALLEYLERNPSVRFVFQPATYHFEWGVEKLAGLYRRAELVVMNREEAVDVTGRSYDSVRELANGLHELGPEKVVITDGANGSYASYDGRIVTIPNYPDAAPPTDRTGAGDAFASTIVAALAQGETMDTALTWAPINSANVVQELGAQAGLLSKDRIQVFLDDAPEWYHVSELEDS